MHKDRHTTTIKTFHSFLGYFNRIDKIQQDDKTYLYFYRRTKNYSNFCFLREYELVVNNAVNLFGIDQFLRGEFDWDKEKSLIQSDKREGRFWDFEDFTLKLENNVGSKELSILISMTD